MQMSRNGLSLQTGGLANVCYTVGALFAKEPLQNVVTVEAWWVLSSLLKRCWDSPAASTTCAGTEASQIRAKQHCIGRLDKTQKQSLKNLNLNMILAIYPIHVPLISRSSSTLRVLETTQQWTNLPCSSTAEISLDPDRGFCHQDQNRVFNMFKLSYAWETLILAPTGSPFFVQNIDTPNRSLHSLRLELPGHCRGTHHRPSENPQGAKKHSGDIKKFYLKMEYTWYTDNAPYFWEMWYHLLG
jgi:hypothetical protein